MITVKELLAQPLFAEFIDLTKSESLDNVVKGTGIYDWETPDVIHNTFESGEFVLAKLDKYYQNRTEYRECIRLLIERQVAVIAFKTKPDESIPQEFIDYANLYNVVLLTYKDIYYDDIIYFIRTLLTGMNSNELLLEKVKKLLLTRNDDRAHSLVQKINALFKGKTRCICIGKDSNDPDIDILFGRLKSIISSSDTIVRCNRSILIFMSYNLDEMDKLEKDNAFIESTVSEFTGFNIGYSSLNESSFLRQTINESVTAFVRAVLDDVLAVKFENCEIIKLVVPILDTPWAMEFHNDFYNVLTDYDNKHNTNFNETLITYIECETDIAKTADRLYQHGNTIRYRLGRIQNLLGFESEMRFNTESAMYVLMHKIIQIKGNDSLI